jgi:hypothetical protein
MPAASSLSLLGWVGGDDQLRLRHDRDAALFGVADRGLPDHRVASDVQWDRFADQLQAAGGCQEVGLRLERGGNRVRLEVEDSANRPERVGQAHDRAAVHAIATVGVLRAKNDAPEDSLRIGLDELDTDVFGKRWQTEAASTRFFGRHGICQASRYRARAAAALAAQSSREAVLVHEVTRHPFERPDVTGMATHDPLAVAVALLPDLVTTLDRPVEIETQGQHTLGQTVVDFRPAQIAPLHTTRVCVDVDPARFKKMLFSSLGL